MIAQFGLDHREGGLDIAVLVVMPQELFAAELPAVVHALPETLRPAAVDRLEGDVGRRAVADITPRQRAMLDFAMKVSQRAQEVGEADSLTLREHGFTDDDIWDIAAIVFGMSNRQANFTSLRRTTSSLR